LNEQQLRNALIAGGMPSAAADVAVKNVRDSGLLPRANDQLISALVSAYNAPGSTPMSRRIVDAVNSWRETAPARPAPAPTKPKVESAGGNVLMGGRKPPPMFTPEQINQGAWALVKGQWPGTVTPPREFVEAADQLKNFLAQGGAGAMGEEPEDPIAAVLAALLGGGGGGGSYGGGAGAGYTEDPVDTPEEIDAFARSNYGYLAAYLEDPEIGPILKQAAREGWDQGRLRGALSNTNWWKTTAQTAREFDAEKNMDPASWEEKVQQRLEQIRRQAGLMGLAISGKIDLGGFGSYDRDYHIAVQSLREGWDDKKIMAALFKEGGFQVDKDYGEGMIGAQADQVKAMARAYMLPVSESQANAYAQAIMEGRMDIEGVEAAYRDLAKGRYPGLAAQIDAGIRPEQFFDTYKQQAAQLLEIDPDTINMMDPKWSPMTELVGADGVRRPMTLSESADYLRSRPEYDRTDNAMTEASRVAELLAKTFGKVG
jgi:hypothetical protein